MLANWCRTGQYSPFAEWHCTMRHCTQSNNGNERICNLHLNRVPIPIAFPGAEWQVVHFAFGPVTVDCVPHRDKLNAPVRLGTVPFLSICSSFKLNEPFFVFDILHRKYKLKHCQQCTKHKERKNILNLNLVRSELPNTGTYTHCKQAASH